MLRHAGIGLAVVVLASQLAAGGGERRKPMAGGWKVVEATVAGKAFKATLNGERGGKFVEELWMVIFKGDSFFYISRDDGRIKGSATFKVDTSKKPMHIDVTASDGPDKGQTNLGIYKLDDKK